MRSRVSGSETAGAPERRRLVRAAAGLGWRVAPLFAEAPFEPVAVEPGAEFPAAPGFWPAAGAGPFPAAWLDPFALQWLVA